MSETKQTSQFMERGFKIGDIAYVAAVVFGDENDSCREDHTLAYFPTEALAKIAAESAVRTRTKHETRDGWWTGTVEQGTITDESFSDPTYGHVRDWQFTLDENVVSTFFAAGKWQR